MAKTPLTAISGIGATTAARLEAAGVGSAEALIAAPQSLLAGLPGFTPARAERVLAAARALLSIPSRDDEPSGEKKRKKKGKRKTKGKGAKADAKKKSKKKDKSKRKKSKDKKKAKK